MNGVTEINAKIRENQRRSELEANLTAKRAESPDLTKKIEAMDAEKAKMLTDATPPISGMSIGEKGVLYKGIPFEQLSHSERLKLSCGMGMVMNPTLRILLIRNGSAFDDENLALLANIAESNDYQIWLERVGKGEECKIIIEDGAVLEQKD